MRKPTEYEIEQSILLGAQISSKHKEFQEFAMTDPDTAFIIWMLKNHDKLKELPSKERTIAILTTMGELEFIRGTTEISRLSMIVGDTRPHLGMKGKMDELRTAEQRSQP